MSSDPRTSEQPLRRCVVRLFVAGDAPNSRLAKENLRGFLDGTPGEDHVVEIIDILEEPQKALKHGIFVTPALQVLEPGPGTLIFGNLSDRSALQSLFRPEAF